MSTESIGAITALKGPSGPTSPQGKAISSQNALQDGLFTAHDFIRPAEQDEYLGVRSRLYGDLNPTGELEFTFADEIVGAAWRLRRCRLIEANIALRAGEDFTLTPDDENRQKSIDRARAQAGARLNRAISALRKIQTERNVRNELEVKGECGLADYSQVVKAIKLRLITDRIIDQRSDKPNLSNFDATLRREIDLPDAPIYPRTHRVRFVNPNSTLPRPTRVRFVNLKSTPPRPTRVRFVNPKSTPPRPTRVRFVNPKSTPPRPTRVRFVNPRQQSRQSAQRSRETPPAPAVRA